MPPHLGQHFLKDQTAIQKIITALDLVKRDLIIEIGSGKGALTTPLLRASENAGAHLIAIEKDKRLVALLKNKYRSKSIEIINADIRKILPKLVAEKTGGLKKYKIVGNIPYYLTGYLLRMISELQHQPTVTVLTIQKEVADRIIEKKPRMNLLAAITGAWSTPEIISFLSPDKFDPPPKVHSAIIRLKSDLKIAQLELPEYFNFVKAIFTQPRKTIINNLRSETLPPVKIKSLLVELGHKEALRPQELDLEEIILLKEKLAKRKDL